MTPRRLALYALALLLPLAMLAVRQAMPVSIEARTMLILFMLPISVSALLGGLGPGLLATAVAGGLTAWFLLPPANSFAIAAGHDLAQWVVLLANGVLVSLMSHALFRTRRGEASAREEQRQSEASYRALFEQAAAGIARVAPDGRFLRVNAKFCAILGYSEAELQARTFMDITHPEDLPTDLEHVRRLHAGEIPSFTREKRFIRKDGSPVWARIHITAVRKPDGTPDYRIGVIEDIAAQKATDEALRERERRLAAIIGFSPSALSLKTPDGRYALANPNLQRIHHCDEAGIVGKTDFDLYPDEVARAFRANDLRVLETRSRQSVEESVPVEGEMRAFMSHMFPVVDDKGEVEYICRISLDITDHKRAEAAQKASSALQEQARRATLSLLEDAQAARAKTEAAGAALAESESRLRLLIDNAPVALALFDRDMRYLAVSRHWRENFELGDREVLGQSHYAIFPDLRDEWKEAHRRGLAGEVVGSDGDAFERRDGQTIWTRWQVLPWRHADGGIGGILIFAENITAQKQAQDALRESEGRFRALVEQSLAGIYIIQDGRFRYVNPGFAAMFGFGSAAEIIEQVPFSELVMPEDRARVAEHIRQRVAGEISDIHYTFAGQRRDGGHIEVEVHGRRFDYQGRPAVIGLILDITARKAAEDSLRESELRFHDIVNASADWVWEVDAQGRYTYASESVRDLLGYGSEELLGKTPFDLMPPDEAARVAAEFAAITTQRKPFRDLENINLRKDGSALYVSTNGMPILDADGRLLGYRGLDRDITERKLADMKLAEREARYRAVIESTSDGFWVVDTSQGRIQIANAAYARLSGYSLEELQGMSVADVEGQESSDEVRAHIERIMREGSAVFESRHRARDGRIWPVEMAVSYWPEGGYMFAFVRDISARKAAVAELKARNDELERFNRATLGRELDMLEMKKTINALSQELGREPPYPLAFLKEEGKAE